MDRFDDHADRVLGPQFMALREQTLTLVRPAGALAARRAAESRYRRRLTAFAVAVVAVVLAAVGGGLALADGDSRGEPAGPPDPVVSPTAGAAEGERLPVTSSPTAPSAGGSGQVGPAGGQVPPGLKLESVTFIDTSTAWALGYAPCLSPHAWGNCPAVVRSRDGGQSWSGVPAPGNAAYLGDIRFATASDGWVVVRAPLIATDPGGESGALYATHDGGSTWKPVPVPGGVLEMETAGGRVWVSTGSPSATGHAIYSSPITRDTFTKATDAAGGRLALHGHYVYVFGAGTALVVLRDGTRTDRVLPCDPDHRDTVLVAAAGDQSLAAVCAGPPSGLSQQKLAFASVDGGATWSPVGAPDPAGSARSLAAARSALFLAGQGMPLRISVPGDTWPAALPAPGPEGFGYVGFTDDNHGVALDGGPSDAVYLTADGGRTWVTHHPD